MSPSQSGAPAQPDDPRQTIPSSQVPPDQPPIARPPMGPPPMAPQPPASARRSPQVALPVREAGSFKRGFGLGTGAGTGFGIALLVVGTVLALLTGLIFTAGMAAAAGAGGPLATVWGKETARKTLRAVDVKGTILNDETDGSLLTDGTYGYEVARMIDELEVEDADGLILRLNTPGGTITGARAIADAVDRYKQRTNKQVFAHVQGISASGGVYAMAGADNILADHGSLVGSIGVILGPISRYRDVTAIDGGLLGGGVTTTGGIEQYYLTQGRGKDVGNPYRDLTDEERAVLTRGLENEYAAFVDHVSIRRGISAQAIRDDLGAHLYDGVVAREKRLIDGVMGIDDAYRHFATLARLDPADTRVVAAVPPTTWEVLLGAEARVLGQSSAVETAPGVRPVTAAAICGSVPTVLVYRGNPQRDCG